MLFNQYKSVLFLTPLFLNTVLNLLFIWFSFLTNSISSSSLYYDAIYSLKIYRKYPNLASAINTRYKKYNDTLDLIEELESKKEIFVLRPSKDLKVKRVEKDINKLQAIYDLGVESGKKALRKLKNYLNK